MPSAQQLNQHMGHVQVIHDAGLARNVATVSKNLQHSQTSPLPGSSRFDLRYPPLFRVAGVDCWFQSYGKGGGYQQRKSHGK